MNLWISAPSGKFVVDEGETPIVLMGAGIGITPMLTMAAGKTERKCHLVYSLPNSQYLAFDEEIRDIVGF